MKVLKDNYNTVQVEESKPLAPYPRKLICEKCESELEYDKSDLKIGTYGCVFLNCPLCNHTNMLDDNEESITLTKDNVEFPTHFHHTSVKTGAVDCCDNEHIKEYIQKAIKYFRENKEEYDYGGHITGNLYINVHRWSGDECYEVSVSNDFYDTYIPFESEDY